MGFSRTLYRLLFPLYKKSVTEQHRLENLFLEITQKCNLDCLHCGSDCVSDSNAEDLPPEGVFVILSGGEPLCYRYDVFKLCQKITDMGFPCGMVTNGFGWNQNLLQKAKKSGIKSISVSLDGLKESHNWLRNNQCSFSKAVHTIKMLLEIPFIEKMDVITCVTPRSLPEIMCNGDILACTSIPREVSQGGGFHLINPATNSPEICYYNHVKG